MGQETPRFAVSAELLRLASDERDRPEDAPGSPGGSVSRTTPEVGGPALGQEPEPVEHELEPLRAVLARTGIAGLASLTGATLIAASTIGALTALAGPLKRSLHSGDGGITGLTLLASVAVLATAPLMGVAADRWGRGRVSAAAVAAGALAGLAATTAGSVGTLVPWVIVLAVGLAAAATAHLAWLADNIPEAAHGRVFAAHGLALPLGASVGAGLVAGAGSAAGSWRWAMLAPLGGLAVIRWLIHLPETGPSGRLDVGLGATGQRLRRVRFLPGLVAAAAVVAFASLGAPAVLAGHLQHHWHLTAGGRRAAVVLVALGALVGLPAGGVLTDDRWSRRPTGLATPLAGLVGTFGVLTVAGGWMPSAGSTEVVWALAMAALSAAGVITAALVVACLPSPLRATGLGVVAGYSLLLGGTAAVVLDVFAKANGSRPALVLAGAGALTAGVMIRRSRDGLGPDLEAAALASRADAGQGASAGLGAEQAGPVAAPAAPGRGPGRGNALEVRGVDFSYGPRQVLHRVDVVIAEGEVAALLGTNGAGKSTLLRLVAGLDHPSAGSIRLFGRDTTYLEAEQIVHLGVALLSGGRMSFPGLSVVENLRIGAHTLRRQGPRLEAALEEALSLFPVLGQRRDQRVGTLSGGEQQMLALARVLLTRPTLLLIDELSLGLAPKAVESLLEVVRRVNLAGTTVLLVEQSANLALNLAAHALFLERGSVRFDGQTAELLGRNDLLRPVFLSGTS